MAEMLRALGVRGALGRGGEGECQGGGENAHGNRPELPGAQLGSGGKWRLDWAVGRTRDKAEREGKASREVLSLRRLGKGLLEQALEGSERADIVFEFSDGRRPFRGHSSVLCAVCEEYGGLFRSGMLEEREGVVWVPPGISVASFKGFLEFMYLGRCGEECFGADGRELIVLSEMYDVGGLRDWLLEDGIGAESVCEALAFGLLEEGDRSDIVAGCLGLARERLNAISDESLRGVGAGVVKGLLRGRLGSEGRGRREGFALVQRWVSANGGPRGPLAGELEGVIEMLGLERLSHRYLSQVVAGSGLVDREALEGMLAGASEAGYARAFEVERSFGSDGPYKFGTIRHLAVHGQGAGQRVAGADPQLRRILVFAVESGECVMSAKVGDPSGVAFSAGGDLLVSDCRAHKISVFSPEGRLLREFGTKGTGAGQLRAPSDLAFSPEGQLVVADYFNHRLQVFREDGSFVRTISPLVKHKAWYPSGLCAGPRGDSMVVSEADNRRVHVLTGLGGGASSVRALGGDGERNEQWRSPLGVAVGGGGEVLVADSQEQRVQVFDGDGARVQTIGPNGESSVELGFPYGLCVDGEGRVFVGCNGIQTRIVMLS